MTTKRHEIDQRISVEVPDDWEIWEASDDVQFVAAAPDMGRDDIQPHFFVSRDDSTYESLEEYLVGNVVYLRSEEGYVEHNTEMLEANGCQIASLTYDAPAGDWIFTNKQYFLIVEGNAYLITCKMLPEQAAKWLGAFDRIVKSVRLAG